MSTNVTFYKWVQETKTIDYELNDVKLDSVQWVKDLGVSIASNLKFSRQCKYTVGKVNRILGFINWIFSFKNWKKNRITSCTDHHRIPGAVHTVCRCIQWQTFPACASPRMGSTWPEYLLGYFDFSSFFYETESSSNSSHKWNNQITP